MVSDCAHDVVADQVHKVVLKHVYAFDDGSATAVQSLQEDRARLRTEAKHSQRCLLTALHFMISHKESISGSASEPTLPPRGFPSLWRQHGCVCKGVVTAHAILFKFIPKSQ